MAAPIGRVRVVLSGFAGAPGLMQFYWNGATAGTFTTADATAATAAVRTFLINASLALSNLVTMTFDPTVEVLEATTGALISVVPASPVAPIGGLATGVVLVAEGPLVQWVTTTVVGRRLLRGRTFLTPSTAGAINATGLVQPTVQAGVISAGNAYIATTPQKPVIWHRPVPFGTGTNGIAGEIVGCGCPAKVAVLRSRRD